MGKNEIAKWKRRGEEKAQRKKEQQSETKPNVREEKNQGGWR